MDLRNKSKKEEEFLHPYFRGSIHGESEKQYSHLSYQTESKTCTTQHRPYIEGVLNISDLDKEMK
ncbi:hypothetical protein BCY86_04845 [Pajaroellobacter abortibovis]|uniref:Uncharacterized protein n=1 Tax=Pajaroellobacter abortibovis TaxID=1882918 RepID=A0A1L6MX01_9BACT|nr:hypothetical protein BCY86_04845 [Pajaroellobacter abortibovis]